MTERSTDWNPIFGGGKFWLESPEPQDFNLGVIAHALSMICRFNGHIRKHYSVAQHSVLAARKAKDKKQGIKLLFHDGAEAYTGDIISPVKRLWPEYEKIENRILKPMGEKFGFEWTGKDREMEEIDKRLLATEVRDLIPKKHHKVWKFDYLPYEEKIVPWSRSKAKREFIDTYLELIHGDTLQKLIRI